MGWITLLKAEVEAVKVVSTGILLQKAACLGG